MRHSIIVACLLLSGGILAQVSQGSEEFKMTEVVDDVTRGQKLSLRRFSLGMYVLQVSDYEFFRLVIE